MHSLYKIISKRKKSKEGENSINTICLHTEILGYEEAKRKGILKI